MSPWLTTALLLLAHNPDTSYARLSISEQRIETRLTYDVFTLLLFVALDDNRDGQLQRGELARHAPEIAAFLRARVGLAVSADDEQADLGDFRGFVWPTELGEAIPGSDFHSANGLIHFDFVRTLDQPPEEVAIAFGFFREFTERHTVLAVFACQGDEYETTFSAYEPDFTYVTGFPPSRPAESPEPPRDQTRHTLAERLWRFFKLGVEHIFLGYDHICFLIALIVVSRLREMVKIVTSFTIAHSLTLILAALDVVRLDTRLVETAIAATVVYVAVENLWLLFRQDRTGEGKRGREGARERGRDEGAVPGSALAASSAAASDRSPTRHRWWLTFFFGLIHGFGFANVLREMGLPTLGLIRCLLAFNVGVEVGQLVIVLALFPLAWALGRWRYGRYAAIAISLTLAAFGAGWFVDRAFGLELGL
jgi:hypothetical protein